MTLDRALRFIALEGVVLESARDPKVPNVADRVLGTERHGSWWGHPLGREFFRLTRRIRSHPDIVVCRLVGGKVTYVHRRLWPALLRLAPILGASRVAALEEQDTESGAHRVTITSLRTWVTADVRVRASRLTLAQARAQLEVPIAGTKRELERRGPTKRRARTTSSSPSR